MTDWFPIAATALAVAAGATASVVGFGIGSLLAPVIAVRYGIGAAVAMVALPHLAASLLRAWRLRGHFRRDVIVRFGLLSAAGGLAGALLYARLGGPALTTALGALLLVTAIAGLTGWTERWHPRGPIVWGLGALSGLFGGLAGNQGGIRAAALSAFGLGPAEFVAASTAAGVLVDVARTPVYLLRERATLAAAAPLLAALVAGTLMGTLLGERVLFGIAPQVFRRVVSVAIAGLGLWLLFGPHSH